MSTAEVSELLSKVPGVLEANVYGVAVPHYDGKAGMVSLHTNPMEFQLESMSAFVRDQLPTYARPLFLRWRTTTTTTTTTTSSGGDNEKTSTFKYQKHRYAQEGFRRSQYQGAHQQDAIYVWWSKSATYVPLTDDLLAQIDANDVRF